MIKGSCNKLGACSLTSIKGPGLKLNIISPDTWDRLKAAALYYDKP
jgi:hypothetical protein